MRKLIAFESVTLDGYFAGPGGDLSWAHGADDPEFASFVQANARSGGTLVFGRITYEMMASHWPTPFAAERDPVVAAGMNAAAKVVFSKTLREAGWAHTRLVAGDLAGEVRRLKAEPGEDLVILGSGSLVAQLARQRLLDVLRLVVCPVAIGRGRTLFEGVTEPLAWRLTDSRTFAGGKVFLSYVPVRAG